MPQEILKFSQLNTGNLDKINGMFEQLFGGCAVINAAGNVIAGGEGWTVNRSATGMFDITFPTHAAVAAGQCILVTPRASGVDANAFVPAVTQITTNTVRVTINDDADAAVNADFSILRIIL